MPSKLHDKINSYPIEYGIEFNQAYTLTPTVTGSLAPTSTAARLVLNGSGTPYYEPNSNPLGGAGSWRINQGEFSLGTQIRTISSTTMPSTNSWSDGEFSTGCWFRFNNFPDYNGDYQFWRMGTSNTSVGFDLYINYNNGVSRFKDNWTSSGLLWGPNQIELNKWYYIAYRKNLSANTAERWLDGQLITTGTNTNTGSNNSAQWGSSGSIIGTYSWNFSNWYVGKYNDIGSTQIQEIWLAGSTGNRTVKYFNGTSWVDSSAQKIYNGTSWVDWNAQRFNGTNWVVV